MTPHLAAVFAVVPAALQWRRCATDAKPSPWLLTVIAIPASACTF
jgi:hypothetical protein